MNQSDVASACLARWIRVKSATATARLVQNTRFHREVLGMNSCAASGPFTFRYLGQEVRRSGGWGLASPEVGAQAPVVGGGGLGAGGEAAAQQHQEAPLV